MREPEDEGGQTPEPHDQQRESASTTSASLPGFLDQGLRAGGRVGDPVELARSEESRSHNEASIPIIISRVNRVDSTTFTNVRRRNRPRESRRAKPRRAPPCALLRGRGGGAPAACR